MTTLQPQTPSTYKRHSLKVDMTPMVDLGFLLITFFIFTTSMAEPRIIKLVMPAKGEPAGVRSSRTLTALLDKDKVYVYAGSWEEATAMHLIRKTTYDVSRGLGEAIRQKQKELEAGDNKEGLILLIKPLHGSTYQNVINALDEVTINNLHYYAVVDATREERAFSEIKN